MVTDDPTSQTCELASIRATFAALDKSNWPMTNSDHSLRKCFRFCFGFWQSLFLVWLLLGVGPAVCQICTFFNTMVNSWRFGTFFNEGFKISSNLKHIGLTLGNDVFPTSMFTGVQQITTLISRPNSKCGHASALRVHNTSKLSWKMVRKCHRHSVWIGVAQLLTVKLQESVQRCMEGRCLATNPSDFRHFFHPRIWGSVRCLQNHKVCHVSHRFKAVSTVRKQPHLPPNCGKRWFAFEV